MQPPRLSTKGVRLVEMYAHMAREGYARADETWVADAFSDFELRPYRVQLKAIFDEHGIETVLDYGCGGSDWSGAGFDEQSGACACDYFGLDAAYRYEPARGLDERRAVDAVVSFDVLEHVFVADVPTVVRDLLGHAKQIAVLNVACYPAQAELPNGENAHVTVRPPHWWKGMLDCLSTEFPQVTVYLLCSTAWRQSSLFAPWSASAWHGGEHFIVED